MKRLIKFRGVDAETGNLVYGSFVDYGEESCGYRYWINSPDDARNHPVDLDSVAQLVGVGRNGREVYEGDRVISPAGYEYTASLHPFPLLDDYTLKEDSK